MNMKLSVNEAVGVFGRGVMIPEIPISSEELEKFRGTHLLILKPFVSNYLIWALVGLDARETTAASAHSGLPTVKDLLYFEEAMRKERNVRPWHGLWLLTSERDQFNRPVAIQFYDGGWRVTSVESLDATRLGGAPLVAVEIRHL